MRDQCALPAQCSPQAASSNDFHPQAAALEISMQVGESGGTSETTTSLARSGSKELSARVSAAEETVQSSQAVLKVLGRLQRLAWCRIDTSFKGSKFPYFAHNHIQVTREWLNWEGEAVVLHLVQKFADLEAAAAAKLTATDT